MNGSCRRQLMIRLKDKLLFVVLTEDTVAVSQCKHCCFRKDYGVHQLYYDLFVISFCFWFLAVYNLTVVFYRF